MDLYIVEILDEWLTFEERKTGEVIDKVAKALRAVREDGF